MKKKRIVLLGIAVLVISFISYATYEYSLAKKYALEICKMAEFVKDKNEIIKKLPSKEEIQKKRGHIVLNDKDNRINTFFYGVLGYDKAVCTLYFKDNKLQHAFHESEYDNYDQAEEKM